MGVASDRHGPESASPRKRGARGRGAADNPTGRFERHRVEPDPAEGGSGEARVPTRVFSDATTSVITRNASPDLGFEFGVNPYRGCEHGCAYCYARPYHEYLGLSAGVDFESKIVAKPDAARLLRAELDHPRWRPAPIAMSGVTDCYQPIERTLRITRACLEVFAEFRNPVAIITKNRLVERDADLLGMMGRSRVARVTLSITTLDAALAREMEPRTSSPRDRLAAIRALSSVGVPVGVNIAPVIPGLNDHEIPAILAAAAEAGAVSAGWAMLRLPHGVKELFVDWLDRVHPGKKARVLARVREVRGGRLDDARFGTRLAGEGVFAEQIRALFRASARRLGLDRPPPELRCDLFQRSGGVQLELQGLR